MRILVLTWNFPPVVGGIEYLVGHVCRGLTQRGHEVSVVTSYHETGASGDHSASRVFRARRSGLPSFLMFALWVGWREIRRRKPSVLLVGSMTAAPVAYLLAKVCRVPLVLLVYGSDLVLRGRIYRFFLRMVLRSSARVVAISRNTALLATRRGARSDRVVIIPPGVDLQPATYFVSPAVAERWDAVVRGRRALLSVGRLIRRKGVLEFVRDVMPLLLSRNPSVLLLVAGDDAGRSLIHKERMSESIAEVIRQKGLSDHVILLGRLSDEDLMAVFARAALFVMPVLNLPDDVEGFGIVQTEAGVLGVPSVSTRVGGVPDAVEDGVTGLLVPPGDPAAMAEAILRLLGDEGLRAGMGQAAARRARECFAWPVIAGRYEDLFTALVKAGGRGR